MNSIWKGEKVRLREMTGADAGLFLDENGDYDTDMLRLYDVIDFPHSREHMQRQLDEFEKTKPQKDDFLFAAETHGRQPMGVLIAFDCDARMGTFKYGLFVKEEYKGKGYAREAAQLLLDYYFFERRYHKCNVYIYDFNQPSIRFHEKLGFRLEGKIRDMVYTGGQYHDTLWYGMTKEEYAKSRAK